MDHNTPYELSEIVDFDALGIKYSICKDENVRIFSSLQAYQKTLGLPVSEGPDMEANPYYGIALDDWKKVALGDKEMYTGTLSGDKGVVMELAAILDQPHWNYKGEADYIWNFFSRYSRDVESGEMVFEK